MERLSVPIGMGCFVILIVVATVVYFIIWRRRELYLQSLPERDGNFIHFLKTFYSLRAEI